MTRFLLDTNVPSELRNDPVDVNVARWASGIQTPEDLFLSVVTVGEIEKGISLAPVGERRQRLELWYRTDVLEWFAGRILPVTIEIARRWGIMTADRRRAGLPLHPADGLIAATAAIHNLTLVTRNIRDFEQLGIALLNPWEQTRLH